MSEITVQGASGAILTLQNGSRQDINSLAATYLDTISKLASAGYADVFNINTNPPVITSNLIGVGTIDNPISIDLSGYGYVIVADSDDISTTDNDVIISSRNHDNASTANVGHTDLVIVSGRRSGLGYLPGNNSGTIINTVGNLNFDGDQKTGNWNIYAGSGNHTIRTGTGQNTISIGTGTSHIYSEGHDNITLNYDVKTNDDYTLAAVTLAGGNSTISTIINGMVTDISSNNEITAFNHTIISAGTTGKINFNGILNSNDSNTIQGGIGNTINSTNSNVTAIHGDSNTFEQIDGNLNFFNGNGDTNATVSKQLIGFGASGLNFTLNDNNTGVNDPSTGSSLFVADQGNETLNASGYHNQIQIYANTVSGAQANFIATGGDGDDVLAAGTGNSTFTGGAGNNLFMFTKETVNNGTTLITDFANQNSHNIIGLYNYGLNNDSLQQLINGSQNDDQGNAILNLENHKITIEGLSVADLKTTQFMV